jgi:hypothetical protein
MWPLHHHVLAQQMPHTFGARKAQILMRQDVAAIF